MDYIREIERFMPASEQEETDRRIMLSYIRQNGHNVLFRESALAHITSSGFLMNPALDRVLLVHHDIRGVWGWTGGHADGDGDLLRVAVREAMEETGAGTIVPLTGEIASIDILPVFAHVRKGVYVNAHLHLSVSYILICGEKEALRPRLGENTGVAWFPIDYFTPEHFDAHDVYLYNKLIGRARGQLTIA